MLELWAAIDLLSGSVVTLRQGKEAMKTSWGGSASDVAARWERDGADGLHIIDLDAAFGKGSNRETILAILKRAKVPVQVGGGVRSLKAAESWLSSGATRVIVGTLAYKEPESLASLLGRHGPERVVVAADYAADGMVLTKGWTAQQEIGVLEAAERLQAAGVVNLLATAVGQDGTAKGPDFATTKALCGRNKKLRVIASGGIRSVDDLTELASDGAAGAVLGRALYDGSVRLAQARSAVGGKRKR